MPDVLEVDFDQRCQLIVSHNTCQSLGAGYSVVGNRKILFLLAPSLTVCAYTSHNIDSCHVHVKVPALERTCGTAVQDDRSLRYRQKYVQQATTASEFKGIGRKFPLFSH